MKSLEANNPNQARLVYAWNYKEWGGSQIYMLSIIKLAQRYFEVHLVVPEGTDQNFLRFLDNLDVRIHLFSPASSNHPIISIRDRINRRINKIRSENAMLKTIEQIARLDTIVHLDLAPQQSFRSLLKLSKKHTVFTTIHNRMAKQSFFRELLWWVYLRSILRVSNFRIFCGNRDTKKYICSYLSKKHSTNIKVTTTAINPEEIKAVEHIKTERSNIFAHLGIPDNKFVVLTVGQFVDRKGRWVLLDAAQRVLSERDDVVFVWLMPTLPNTSERGIIEDYGMKTGFCSVLSADVGRDRQSILEFIKLADVFVLPSLVDGLPIAILEAMALGIPTISTRVNAIPEAIENDKTGLLVAPANAVELARAVSGLLDEPAKRKALANAGRKFVLKNFDERKVAEIAVRSYHSSLAAGLQR